MSYGKEIGQILAEEVLELVLIEELELMEIRDLDRLGAHINDTEKKYGKTHAKTKALKRLYKRKSGIEGIRNFGKPETEMSEAELQEIRGLNRLNMALNKSLLSQDPEDRQHAMRLQALKRRKQLLGFDEGESVAADPSKPITVKTDKKTKANVAASKKNAPAERRKAIAAFKDMPNWDSTASTKPKK